MLVSLEGLRARGMKELRGHVMAVGYDRLIILTCPRWLLLPSVFPQNSSCERQVNGMKWIHSDVR